MTETDKPAIIPAQTVEKTLSSGDAVAAKAAAAAAGRLIAERNDAGSDKALVDQAIAGL